MEFTNSRKDILRRFLESTDAVFSEELDSESVASIYRAFIDFNVSAIDFAEVLKQQAIKPDSSNLLLDTVRNLNEVRIEMGKYFYVSKDARDFLVTYFSDQLKKWGNRVKKDKEQKIVKQRLEEYQQIIAENKQRRVEREKVERQAKIEKMLEYDAEIRLRKAKKNERMQFEMELKRSLQTKHEAEIAERIQNKKEREEQMKLMLEEQIRTEKEEAIRRKSE